MELVTLLLKPDPNERIPLIKIFDHPWIKIYDKQARDQGHDQSSASASVTVTEKTSNSGSVSDSDSDSDSSSSEANYKSGQNSKPTTNTESSERAEFKAHAFTGAGIQTSQSSIYQNMVAIKQINQTNIQKSNFQKGDFHQAATANFQQMESSGNILTSQVGEESKRGIQNIQ